MATLHLPLKGKYFDQIKSGEKLEEYRLATPFWAKRIEGREYDQIELAKGYPPRGDTSRRITRPWCGYRKTTITHPHFGPDPVEVYAIRVNPYHPGGPMTQIDTSTEVVVALADVVVESQPYSPNLYKVRDLLETLAAERDQAIARERALLASNQEARDFLKQRDTLSKQVEDTARECAELVAENKRLRRDLAEARNAALDEVGAAADELGYHCVGCGHLCGDPERDLESIRKAGGLSCCPEREMEPLSEAISSMVKRAPAPRQSVQEAAKVLLDHWFDANRKASEELTSGIELWWRRGCNPETSLHHLLRALSQEGQSDE